MTTRVSVPGNLLIMGEYAVLEEGGLGITVAPDVRVVATQRLDVAAEVIGRYPGGEERWTPDSRLADSDAGLLSSLLHYFTALENTDTTEVNVQRPALGRLTVDSTALFTPDGRKRGLGSSAAVTVAVAAFAVRAYTGGEVSLQTAVSAHRAAQGGHGSGYDVATSLRGGVLRFTGGATPEAARLEIPWLRRVALFSGATAVRTVSSVGAYRDWRRTEPEEAAAFVRESNDLVCAFAGEAPAAPERAATILRKYRRLANDLGRRIGVPAEIDLPGDRRSTAWLGFKAVGAGAELGIALENSFAGSGSGAQPAGGDVVPVSADGLRWE